VDDHTWYGQTWPYHIMQKTFPAYVTTTRMQNQFVERLRDGIRVWNASMNRCGLPLFRGFQSAYRGDSQVPEPFSQDNNESTISFAHKPCNKSLLGCVRTRVAYRREQPYPYDTHAGFKWKAKESDVQIRRDLNWRERRSDDAAPCNNETDLVGLAAHEVGHVVGLGDTYKIKPYEKNKHQIMGHLFDPCDFSTRRLGRADYIGLTRLYRLR
jgi:hypothetical protein